MLARKLGELLDRIATLETENAELRAEVEKWRIAEGEAMLVVKSQELTIERLREMYKTDTITWRDKYWAAKAELEAAHTASEEGE